MFFSQAIRSGGPGGTAGDVAHPASRMVKIALFMAMERFQNDKRSTRVKGMKGKVVYLYAFDVAEWGEA